MGGIVGINPNNIYDATHLAFVAPSLPKPSSIPGDTALAVTTTINYFPRMEAKDTRRFDLSAIAHDFGVFQVSRARLAMSTKPAFPRGIPDDIWWLVENAVTEGHCGFMIHGNMPPM